jgi:hypothetical protein
LWVGLAHAIESATFGNIWAGSTVSYRWRDLSSFEQYDRNATALLKASAWTAAGMPVAEGV